MLTAYARECRYYHRLLLGTEMKILISHSTKDTEIVEIISTALKRSSLGQLSCWYSSDNSGTGGIQAGRPWYDKLRQELENTQAILCVVTPNSINSAWLYFESGFGAALDDVLIIPVLLGMRIDDIGMPLAGYQMYDLNSFSALKTCVEKLFAHSGIRYDDEILSAPLKTFHSDLLEVAKSTNVAKSLIKTESSPPDSEARVIELLRTISNKIDRTSFHLADAVGGSSQEVSVYELELPVFDSAGDAICDPLIITVYPETSVQDVLNDMYYALGDHVEAWTYLAKWVAVETSTNRKIIIREVSIRIPAHYVFRPGEDYHIELLERPYDPETDSIPENIS
jgi:TIR domain-containing protein